MGREAKVRVCPQGTGCAGVCGHGHAAAQRSQEGVYKLQSMLPNHVNVILQFIAVGDLLGALCIVGEAFQYFNGLLRECTFSRRDSQKQWQLGTRVGQQTLEGM